MDKKERKEAILKMQFSMAMNGSIEMLKWLGIQYCKQSNQPTTPQDELPNGFDIRRIPNEYEQEIVQEYEENKEEFLRWKESEEDFYLTKPRHMNKEQYLRYVAEEETERSKNMKRVLPKQGTTA